MHIGSKIKKIRLQKGLTQEQLSQISGISYTSLTKIETGVVKNPSFEFISKLSQALNVSMDQFTSKPISKNLLKFESYGTKVYIPLQRYEYDLSLTENPLGYSPKVKEALIEELDYISKYPDAQCNRVRKVISDKFEIPKEKIIFGTGADGLLENIVRTIINPGDNIVLPELSFLNIAYAAIICGGDAILSKMKPTLHIDFESLLKSINNKTKLVFLCNPNNPTGLVENVKDIEYLVKNTKSYVVVDEANIEYGGQSVIKLTNKYQNLVVIKSFSKAYGLAGLRIGYCVGDPELMYYIWRLRPPFAVSNISQVGAEIALNDDDFIQKSRIYMSNERNYLTSSLNKLGLKVITSEADCILAKVTPIFSSSTFLNDKLHTLNCNVVDGIHFKGLGEDYVRIAPQLHKINEKFIDILRLLITQ